MEGMQDDMKNSGSPKHFQGGNSPPRPMMRFIVRFEAAYRNLYTTYKDELYSNSRKRWEIEPL